MSGQLSITWRGRACMATLNRAAVGNALSHDLVEDLHLALDEAVAGQATLLVLTGEGRHFCTGFDLSSVEHQEESSLLHRFVRIEMLLSRLYTVPFVTLAYVNGAALGAGADLYAACSRRFSGPSARFAFPGAGFGLLLGTRRLAQRVGASTAEELVVSGRAMDASEAVGLGLTLELVEPDAFEALLEREVLSADRLDRDTLGSVRRLLTRNDEDSDLADLVRSAIRPGLRERIINHRARTKKREERPLQEANNQGAVS